LLNDVQTAGRYELKVRGLGFDDDNARRPSYYNVYARLPHDARWRRAWRKP